ncbi:sugar transferase [Rhodopila sp.]|uniref:sugar transferase n=1 Tax=Rhodopila sp. TaxID=2480087 RepID=UPI003D0AF594
MQRAAAHHLPVPVAGLSSNGERRGLPLLDDAAPRRKYIGRINPDRMTAEDFRCEHGLAPGAVSKALKRLCDVAIGGCLLIGLLPLLAMTAVAIRLDSRGSVFDCQPRVGLLDRPFTLLRFRCMTTDLGLGFGRRRPREARITRIGGFLRASGIEALPQLINLVRGDVSLVGPRPERPHVVGQMARSIRLYHQRHDVRPGLTGWAEVNLGAGGTVEDARKRLAYDLYYVKHHGLILDLVTLLATVCIGLPRRGDG